MTKHVLITRSYTLSSFEQIIPIPYVIHNETKIENKIHKCKKIQLVFDTSFIFGTIGEKLSIMLMKPSKYFL